MVVAWWLHRSVWLHGGCIEVCGCMVVVWLSSGLLVE